MLIKISESLEMPLNAATKTFAEQKRRTGWKHSEEAKEKIRAKRAKQVFTNETKEKMRKAHLGKKHTVAELLKMSESQKGRIFPDSVREKMSRWQIGDRNNRWRGGITPFRRKLRNLGKYQRWRNTILERDIGCKYCSSVENIEVDHYPIPLKEILLKHQINSVGKALECAELWDTNNGRVLCHNHHEEHTYKESRTLKEAIK